jgi:hypothetical protein
MAPLFSINHFVVLPDTSIVFEERETGILQRYCTKNKQITGFQCKELDSLHTLYFSGLCFSGDVLYHARGGRLKKYDILSASKPKAQVLDDTFNYEYSSFCLHQGYLYFSSHSRLYMVGSTGKCQLIPIKVEFSCMVSSPRGLLLCSPQGLSVYLSNGEVENLLHISLQDPRQVLEYNSEVYIVEKRGICKVTPCGIVLYSLPKVDSIALDSNKLWYLRENKIFFLEDLRLGMIEDL